MRTATTAFDFEETFIHQVFQEACGGVLRYLADFPHLAGSQVARKAVEQ
jgi:hypothetical protein